MSDVRLEKEKRRSRVRSIKNAIIAFVIIWIIVSIVFTGFLTYKVFSFEKKLTQITETIGTENKADIMDDSGLIASTQMPEIYDNQVPKEYVTAESNLAGLDDTIKVYLTFDDGPSPNTDKILDILDDYGIKATFFVQGMDPEIYGNEYRRIVDEGHTLGMHTYSHVYKNIYATLDSFKEDVNNIRNLIFDTTGYLTNYYRFPGGSSNGVSHGHIPEYIEYLDSQGINYYDWNVASGDATSPALSADTIVENVTRDVVRYKTSIVLMHDSMGKETTVEALPTMIEKLQEMGAIILPISEDTTVIQHVRP